MPGSIRPLMFAALGLVGVLFAVLLALGFVSQSGNATEFFLLGPGGTTEGLPVRVTSGTPVSVEVGISNHDGSAQSYRIVVESQAARLGAAGPISVGSGQMWTGDLDFTVPKPGRDQEIRILLYRGSSVEPYRVLMLTVEALAPTSTSSASRPVQPQAEDQEALAQLSEVDAPDFKLVIDPARQPLPHRRSVPSDAAYDPCHAPLLDPVLIRPSPSLKGGCYR